MCGFAGVVIWEERFRVGRETLARLSAPIAHRGPDGEGLWLNHEEQPTRQRPQCGLVHRRLAIIDPDPRANQPFTDGRGRWIVFNGEIYNFRALRDELSRMQTDYIWQTQCDTEVLLLAYDVWGERCVERLNGMFAFAVWDERNSTLYIARDRMGQKPLYWAAVTDTGQPWHGIPAEPVDPNHPKVFPNHGKGRASTNQPLGALAFASELEPLRTLNWVDTAIDRVALGDYLDWGYVPAPRTIYKGARKLPPAQYGTFAPALISAGEYFDPNDPQLVDDEAQNEVETTRRLLLQSVQRQLVSDVPLGCFLSGGIDSSIIAAAMKSAVADRGEVHTFSIGFDDARYDETPYAAAVAQHLGTIHRQFIVKPDAAADLPKLARVFGEPFGDSSALPTHYLSRETRAHVKVALSGDGGDELFGGYDRYRAMHLAQRLHRIPRVLRNVFVPHLADQLADAHPKSMRSRGRRFLRSLNAPPAERYASYMRLFDRPTIDQLWPGKHSHAGGGWVQMRYTELLARRSVTEASLATDRVTYLPEDLLTKVDRASMLHALEVRSPFMDHELVRFAAGLTRRQLITGGGKRLLREAFSHQLPKEVFNRPKMGFAVPIGQWFRASLKPMLHDHLLATDSFAAAHFDSAVVERLLEEHESQRVDHSQRLYALLMLELWHRQTVE